ncbi:hypothetical protein Tco_1164598, partial [Tanacetum coccineum]
NEGGEVLALQCLKCFLDIMKKDPNFFDDEVEIIGLLDPNFFERGAFLLRIIRQNVAKVLVEIVKERNTTRYVYERLFIHGIDLLQDMDEFIDD